MRIPGRLTDHRGRLGRFWLMAVASYQDYCRKDSLTIQLTFVIFGHNVGRYLHTKMSYAKQWVSRQKSAEKPTLVPRISAGLLGPAPPPPALVYPSDHPLPTPKLRGI